MIHTLSMLMLSATIWGAPAAWPEGFPPDNAADNVTTTDQNAGEAAVVPIRWYTFRSGYDRRYPGYYYRVYRPYRPHLGYYPRPYRWPPGYRYYYVPQYQYWPYGYYAPYRGWFDVDGVAFGFGY